MCFRLGIVVVLLIGVELGVLCLAVDPGFFSIALVLPVDNVVHVEYAAVAHLVNGLCNFLRVIPDYFLFLQAILLFIQFDKVYVKIFFFVPMNLCFI